MTAGVGAPSRGILAPDVRWLTVGILSVITLFAFEAMGVATAMPVAVADLDGLPAYAWAFSGYLVTSLVAMVVSGEASDAWGPRRPVVVGLALFGAGLVVAGTAPAMPAFVLGRALQGLGGGAVIVAVYVVAGRAYDEDRRPRLFAALASAWVLPSVVGPVLAGLAAEHLSWRLVFLVVPVLLVPPVVALVPRLRALDGGTPSGRLTGRTWAAVGAALGLALLQAGMTRLDGLGALAVALGAAVMVPTVPRLLPAGTLRFRRGLPTAVAMRGVLAGAFFGAEAYVPLMLVTQRELTPTQAGLSLTGAALGWSAGSWYQGRPTTTLPRERLVQAGSAVVAGAILGGAVVLAPWVPAWVAALAWTLGGVGMGLGMASVAVLLLKLSPPEDQGVNSAALQVSDSLSSVVFVGVGGAVYAYVHANPDAVTAGFALIFVLMAALAALGTAVAPRLRPA